MSHKHSKHKSNSPIVIDSDYIIISDDDDNHDIAKIKHNRRLFKDKSNEKDSKLSPIVISDDESEEKFIVSSPRSDNLPEMELLSLDEELPEQSNFFFA